MKLRIWSVVTALLLFAGFAGCGEELPATVSSATPAPTPASLTTPVLPFPTAVDKRRSEKDRSVSAVGAADLGELVRGSNTFALDRRGALRDGEGNLGENWSFSWTVERGPTTARPATGCPVDVSG